MAGSADGFEPAPTPRVPVPPPPGFSCWLEWFHAGCPQLDQLDQLDQVELTDVRGEPPGDPGPVKLKPRRRGQLGQMGLDFDLPEAPRGRRRRPVAR